MGPPEVLQLSFGLQTLVCHVIVLLRVCRSHSVVSYLAGPGGPLLSRSHCFHAASAPQLCCMAFVQAVAFGQPIASSITLNASPNPVTYGQTLTLAAVTSNATATREDRGVPTTALSLLASGFEPVTTSHGRCSEFTLHSNAYALSVHPAKLVLNLASSPGKRAGPTVSIRFSGADPDAWLEPSDRQPGVTNYLSSSDPKAWRTGIPSYRRVQAHSVYPGIDLLYYSSQGQVEYDLLIAPHADPNRIRLKIAGARAIRLDRNGDLVLDTDGGEIRQRKPVLYQERNSRSLSIDGHYVLLGRNEVGFQVGSYDQSTRLVIDPALTFSTYFAGAASTGNAIAVDSSGYIYVTGSASNSIFIAKLDPSTSQSVYTTIIQETGAGNAIAVDAAGQAYVGGYIYTLFSYTNFPLVNPLQSTFVPHSNTGFVIKLNSAGSAPLFSTFFDGTGSSVVKAITVDSSANAYVTGATSTADFPVANSYRSCQSNGDGFIAKIDTSTPALTFSTCFGGSGDDAINAIARDASGNLWVTGQTGSADLPQQNSLLGPGLTSNDMRSAFIAKFDSSASNLLLSTYLGSPTNTEHAPASGNAITTDAAGNAYITGAAPLNRNYLLSGELQGLSEVAPNGGCFVSKLSSSGTLIFSTLLSTVWPCTGIALASDGGIAVTGASSPTTYTPGLPLVDPVQSAIGNFPAGFVAVFANDGSAIRFSTYLGTTAAQNQLNGIAADASSKLYVTGYAWGAGYPLTGQIQEYASSTQAVVSRISLASTCTYQVSPTAISVSAGDIQYRYVNVTAPAGCVWNATGSYVVGQPVVGAPEDTSDIYLSSGSDTVSLKIDFSGYADQTWDIVVAGHRVKLALTGYGCTYSLVQTHASYSASGGFGSVWVNTSQDCPYTATPDSNWITIVFSGDGLVNYLVAANTGAARQGTITIAGLTYTVTQDAAPVPVLAAAVTHIGTFYQSQTGAAYTIVISNRGAGATTGTVTVVDTLPSGLTATAISGTGWTCGLPTLTCTRSDSLAAGAGFAPITLRVDVAANANSPLSNQASVSGGGSATIGTSDVTTINPPPTALRFVPVTPCRIVDTRNATGAFGGPQIAGGSSRSFIIPSSSCNIPATAQAYSLNVAVVPSGPLGYLTVWPADSPTSRFHAQLPRWPHQIQCRHRPCGNLRRHQRLRQQPDAGRARHQRLLHPGHRSHRPGLLSHHPLPRRRYPQKHRAARRSLACWCREPHLPHPFRRLQHPRFRTGLLAQLRRHSQGAPRLSHRVVQRPTYARSLFPQRHDRLNHRQCRHRAGRNRRRHRHLRE